MNAWEIGIRILCFAAALAFTGRYLTVRWYTYPEGRNLMALSAIITGYLALVVSAALFGRYDFYSYVSNTLFFCTFLTLVQQNRLLHLAQKEGRLANPEAQATLLTAAIREADMDRTVEYIKYSAKAVYAGLAALIAGVVIALTPDSANVSDVTSLEKWVIAGSVVAAVGGVFGLQNGPKPGSEPDAEPAVDL